MAGELFCNQGVVNRLLLLKQFVQNAIYYLHVWFSKTRLLLKVGLMDQKIGDLRSQIKIGLSKKLVYVGYKEDSFYQSIHLCVVVSETPDGHSSYLTFQFDRFCAENNMKHLWMPANSSRLSPPLEFGCFAVFKRAYSRLRGEIARRGYNNIVKFDFLDHYQGARLAIF